MKAKYCILSVVFACMCVYSSAQIRNTKNSYVPSVTKGYYSIGRNAQKLNNHSLTLLQTSTYYHAQKGYYTISEKRYKLPKFYKVNATPAGAKMPVKKGYYSIGNKKN